MRTFLTLVLVAVFLFLLPGHVFADSIPEPSKWLLDFNPGGGIFAARGIDYLTKIIPWIISVLLFLLIALSLIFLLYGGIMWIMNGGNKEGMAKARGTVTWAIIGLALGLGSFIIIQIISYFFNVDLGLGIPKAQTCQEKLAACAAKCTDSSTWKTCTRACQSLCSGQDCYALRSQCYENDGCLKPSLTAPQQLACMNNCDKICTP